MGGAAREDGRSGARRRTARSGDGRFRREWPERRFRHRLADARARERPGPFRDELPALERLARENFAGLRSDLVRLGIDCDLEETGELTVALEPHEEAWLEEGAELLRRFGHDVELFDGPSMRAEVASPTFRGGVWDRTDAGILDPGKLAAGLREAALRLGVRVHEQTPVCGLHGTELVVPRGRVRARRVLLATSAYPPLMRAIRRYVVPVYD